MACGCATSATRPAAAALRARGKSAGVIACVPANRVNRITFAMARDQVAYDPHRRKT